MDRNKNQHNITLKNQILFKGIYVVDNIEYSLFMEQISSFPFKKYKHF